MIPVTSERQAEYAGPGWRDPTEWDQGCRSDTAWHAKYDLTRAFA